jgi:hypothetical protein
MCVCVILYVIRWQRRRPRQQRWRRVLQAGGCKRKKNQQCIILCIHVEYLNIKRRTYYIIIVLWIQTNTRCHGVNWFIQKHLRERCIHITSRAYQKCYTHIHINIGRYLAGYYAWVRTFNIIYIYVQCTHTQCARTRVCMCEML